MILRRLRAGRTEIPIGAGDLLWTRGHVDDIATGVLAALDTDAAAGMTINLGEPSARTIRWWLERILDAAGSDATLVRVPDDALPADLALTASPAQHLLASVDCARRLLAWSPEPAERRIAESVRWHLDHPPGEPTWTPDDAVADDAALAVRISGASD